MTAQQYWDIYLSYNSKTRAMHNIGHAMGWREKPWSYLSEEIQRKLKILWNMEDK